MNMIKISGALLSRIDCRTVVHRLFFYCNGENSYFLGEAIVE